MYVPFWQYWIHWITVSKIKNDILFIKYNYGMLKGIHQLSPIKPCINLWNCWTPTVRKWNVRKLCSCLWQAGRVSLSLVPGPLWTLSPSDHQWWWGGGEESQRRRMRRWRGVGEEREDMKRLSAPWGDLVHSSRAANSRSERESEKGRRLLSKIKPVFMEKVKRQTSCNTSHDSKGLIWGWIKVHFPRSYKRRFSLAGCGGCWCAQGYQFLAGVDVHRSPWISIIVSSPHHHHS